MVFDPLKPLATEIKVIENALVVPFAEGTAKGIAKCAGVYDQEGAYVEEAQSFRNSSIPTTVQPRSVGSLENEEYLAGTWIWGGLLYGHFGHMLLESTGRLWLHDHVDAGGEIFLLKKNVTWPKRFIKPLAPALDRLGAKTSKTRGVIRPTRVEKLIVAPQGFGTGDMIAACPEMRSFIKSTWGRGITPKGHEKIYISRSRLYSKRGRYLGEDRIESLLKKEGYAIFHPQDHSMEEQIAQYKAANVVISSDSSALHLHAPFACEETKVAIILRRPGDTIADYLTQYSYFAKLKPNVISALKGRIFQFNGAKNAQMSEIYSEIDFPMVGSELFKAGYINAISGWSAMSSEDVDAEVKQLSERLGVAIKLSERFSTKV